MVNMFLGILAGGAVGAVGVQVARGYVVPAVLKVKAIAARPRLAQFAADMTVALFAAPGVVMGHVLIRSKSPGAALRAGIASATKA